VIGWPVLISDIAAPATDCIGVCELASCAAGAFLSAHQPAHSSNPKTFQLRTIAALPEPAGRPTHGLLSRRSTDRISTSPLANFAQLSMFRFDELIIAMSIGYSNTY
jgi:hypothetical protein